MMQSLIRAAVLAAFVLSYGRAGAQEADAGAEAPAEKSPITVLPRLLETAQAPYPERAVSERVEADVLLEIDIDAAGAVEAARVAEPSKAPGYGFEEAAVEAALKFRFSPAMAGETAAPVRITYRYRFVLAPPPPPPPPPPVKSEQARAPEKPAVVNLQGQLLVRGTREPIAGVTVNVFRGKVTAPEQAFETTTDSQGRFQFYDLAPGAWNLLVEADGFFPVRSTETVAAGERTELRYFVERGDYNPFDVLVEATRPRREVSRTSLEIPQIERIPGTAGDVLRVVQNLPGVARAEPFSGQIIVRGAAPEDTRTVVEGMNIPLIYHFGGLRSAIPTPMLQGIDFYPGNFPPAFGRATGGMIDVRLKRLEPERFGVKADVSVIDASLYVEAPLGDKAAIAIAGRRSYLDFVVSAATAAAGAEAEVNVVTAPRYYDAQVLLEVAPAEGHDLRLFGLLSNDQLRVLFSQPISDDGLPLQGNGVRFETGFYRAILEYAYRPSERLSNVLSVAAGTDSNDSGFAQFQTKGDTLGVQLRNTTSYRATEHFRLEAGVDELLERNTYSIVQPALTREGEAGGDDMFNFDEVLDSKVDGDLVSSFGAYALLDVAYGGLNLLPGVRYDYFTRAEGHRVSPRLTARYQVVEPWTLKAAAGLFYQEPTVDETDGSFGNPELRPEGAVHYSAGVEYRPTKFLTFEATGFYKTLFDLVARSDRVVERDGELVEERLANIGKGRVFGGEFMVRHDFANNFMGWVTYTVMRSERKDGPDEPWRLFDYDQTHILTALGTYRLPRNWEVGFRFRLVSGNPSTPVTGAILNADGDEYEAVYGRVNSDRVPPFHQLDLRIEKQWIYTQWRLSAYLDIQNVYNRANPDQPSYNFDYSKWTYSQGLPILPIFGFRGEY